MPQGLQAHFERGIPGNDEDVPLRWPGYNKRPTLFSSVAIDTNLGSDAFWARGFYPPGAIGSMGYMHRDRIQASTLYRGELVVAGEFGIMDGTEVSNIASWNGSRWKSFGSGFQFWHGVYRLAVYRDRLIASGLSYHQ